MTPDEAATIEIRQCDRVSRSAGGRCTQAEIDRGNLLARLDSRQMRQHAGICYTATGVGS